MQDTHDNPFSRGMLFAAAALVGISVLAIAFTRVTGVGAAGIPEAAPVKVRELRFLDRSDGSVAVTTADERLVARLAPGTNGFARSVMRGFARDRKRQAIGDGPVFRLVRWSDGRLSLEDPATGRHVDLEPFGPTNLAVFVRILDAGTDRS